MTSGILEGLQRAFESVPFAGLSHEEGAQALSMARAWRGFHVENTSRVYRRRGPWFPCLLPRSAVRWRPSDSPFCRAK